MRIVRRGEPGDLPAVLDIQQSSPEAARWNVADYPNYDFRVVCESGQVVGFLVARTVAPDEAELLNLAVAPEWRTKGVGYDLLITLLREQPGTLYLEVRESNTVARKFYKSMGFQEVSIRQGYYESPPDAAIVMKFHSC